VLSEAEEYLLLAEPRELPQRESLATAFIGTSSADGAATIELPGRVVEVLSNEVERGLKHRFATAERLPER